MHAVTGEDSPVPTGLYVGRKPTMNNPDVPSGTLQFMFLTGVVSLLQIQKTNNQIILTERRNPRFSFATIL